MSEHRIVERVGWLMRARSVAMERVDEDQQVRIKLSDVREVRLRGRPQIRWMNSGKKVFNARINVCIVIDKWRAVMNA